MRLGGNNRGRGKVGQAAVQVSDRGVEKKMGTGIGGEGEE